MNEQELDAFLRSHTDSEKRYLSNPGGISERYKHIKKQTYENHEVYIFSFESLLVNKNISILKESRFTPIPVHMHSVIEISYVYSGSCTQIINGHPVTLNKGDAVLLDTNTPHSIEKLGEHDIVITVDMNKKYFLDGIIQRISKDNYITKFLVNCIFNDKKDKQYILFKNQNCDDLNLMFRKLMCEYYKEDFEAYILDAYMILIFSLLASAYKESNFTGYNVDKKYQIFDILQYLEENYLTITLEEAARHFNFNANYFSNYIKKQTGKTFKELIIQKKMSTACYYLINTDVPIYQICKDVGYENLGFFYQKFNDIYKISPQEYRDLHKI